MVSKQLGVNCVLRPGLRQLITIFCRRSSFPITLYVLPFGSTVLRNPFFHVCRSLNTQVSGMRSNEWKKFYLRMKIPHHLCVSITPQAPFKGFAYFCWKNIRCGLTWVAVKSCHLCVSSFKNFISFIFKLNRLFFFLRFYLVFIPGLLFRFFTTLNLIRGCNLFVFFF